ncbi:uroplakin-1a [Latimeria chalumnae]|nr:PREDICTED: uroplakin-1a [Latimeria chalumnae]XP_005999216.1 PREDICTED: uroplakin-1a [Latimeria chalumnae]|eukprot:XP_005999215.1 PREDICTED: uroplakin-1a [Latimeria chalumnae]
MADGKGGSSVGALLIFGNLIILMAGLALFAETIWVNTDEFKVYTFLGVSGKDDVFAGAWIAIFCGFCFFLLGTFGIFAVLKQSRTMVMTYLILMLIVYIFETASCITSFTHRDYVVSNPNFLKKQMLQLYTSNTSQGIELTEAWNRVMLEEQCCGVEGPMDWISFSSTYQNSISSPSQTSWPLYCCKRDKNFIMLSELACLIGHKDFVFSNGCWDFLSFSVNKYTWGVSWFGFAILMWTFVVMCLKMYFYTII